MSVSFPHNRTSIHDVQLPSAMNSKLKKREMNIVRQVSQTFLFRNIDAWVSPVSFHKVSHALGVVAGNPSDASDWLRLGNAAIGESCTQNTAI